MYVKDSVKNVVVSKQTIFYKIDRRKSEDYRKSVLEELTPISDEMVEDFEKKNEKEGELARQLNLTINYVLLGEKASQDSPKTLEESTKQWEEFHQKYPNSPGIISLSRVGFNSDKDQALVYTANSCGNLCGKGYYVLLMKSDKGWKVQKEIFLWVS